MTRQKTRVDGVGWDWDKVFVWVSVCTGADAGADTNTDNEGHRVVDICKREAETVNGGSGALYSRDGDDAAAGGGVKEEVEEQATGREKAR